MRIVALFLLALPLAAQQLDKPAASASPAPAPAAVASPAPAADPSPARAGESWLTGSVDLGYRWVTGVGGSYNAYRSVVDLGSGPKLLGADFTITDPKHRVFDQIHVRAYDWGDEPYSTFHLDAKKKGLYDFNADYRDFALFNSLPSFADPLLGRGIMLDEQSLDTRRHFGSFSLDLLPGNWFIPYLDFDRDSGSGTGVSTFVNDGDQFPVPDTLRDSTNLYRGGVRFELKRFHATLEQGGTTFRDDQSVYQSGGAGLNFGNVLTPVLGQQLDLSSLLAAYGIRGTSVYSKGLFTANPTSWLDLYGQFLFSQPSSAVNYQQAAAGNLLLQNQILFYDSQQFLLSAAAELPHTTANFAAEIRPTHRLRITEAWLTDRLHNSGSASSSQILANAALSEQMTSLLASSLMTDYSQVETDVFYEAGSKLTLRGGYRYVWGQASDAVLPPAGLVSSDFGRLSRNVGIGGATYRASQKLTLSGEVEAASSGGGYFRTSLYDYQKVRAQARYQVSGSLSLAADFTLLNNRNPLSGINYDYLASQESLSFFWSPAGGKRFDFQGSYGRSALYSDIGYFSPQDLQSQVSIYRENAHIGSSLFDVNLPKTLGLSPKISAGGSFFISSGSRPTSYFQPLAKLWLPLGKKLDWFAQWAYYGYGEAFYLYEGFRSNMVTTGLRFTR